MPLSFTEITRLSSPLLIKVTGLPIVISIFPFFIVPLASKLLRLSAAFCNNSFTVTAAELAFPYIFAPNNCLTRLISTPALAFTSLPSFMVLNGLIETGVGDTFSVVTGGI